MNIKKNLSCATVAAIALSVSAVNASAIEPGATVVDFEDGDYSFVYMNVNDGADNSVLSVEDYDGSKQLKVDVQDHKLVPKVWFDVYSMMDKASAPNINSIEFDLTLVPKNSGDAIGYAGGAIGAAGKKGDQVNPSWSQGDWACTDNNAYTAGMPAKVHCVRKFLLPSEKFNEKSESPFFGLMRWAGETDYVMYFDNIVFYDKDNKPIALGESPAPAEETTAETTAEAAAEQTEETTVTLPAAEQTEETTAASEEAAPAEDIPAEEDFTGALEADGFVKVSDGGTSANWGQAVKLPTYANIKEDEVPGADIFYASLLNENTAVVVTYESDQAPELILQSWSGGEGWAKVPANETYSSEGVAVFTYDYMTAMYGTDDFSTVDCVYIGDTGVDLTVSEVDIVDVSTLGNTEEETEETTEDEAAEEETTEDEAAEETAAPAAPEAPAAPAEAPAKTSSPDTGNMSAVALAGILAVAGSAAIALRKRK